MRCAKCGQWWYGEWPAEGEHPECPACGHVDVDDMWWNEDWRDGWFEWLDSDVD